jgi:acetyl esterase/lipase
VVLLACLALSAGCADPPSGPRAARPADRTVDYLPGLQAEVYLPAAASASMPVVLLLPGGGWRTADPAGLRPLAAWLAARGVPAVTATYRVADDAVRLPRSVADIRCAAAFAAETTAVRASAPRPVVLLGHSSGAHLAAIAVLAPAAGRASCGRPRATFVGLVGLAGPYDLGPVADLAAPLVGAAPADDPAAWRAADPLAFAARAPAGLAVLLLHGTSDTLVPVRQTSGMGRALRKGGTDVTVRLLVGADHDTVYTPGVAGRPLLRWLRDARWRKGTGAA